ncbi:ATP-binding protein [Streptomyces sp. MUM 203J]|uniref:ATP-binding protein n=1 Tax=Streptomyces sp. MUM 203J TaxID=2791990 RepID=UPI001F04F02F|nr:ATP-binding protein [Streptomyces sp. MUM 203J]MCH0540118.1 ATP-binding protein [Streptomyces sp. MUM 203J]
MSRVIDTQGACAEWTFPAEPDSVRTARRVVRDTLRAWRLEQDLGDLTVLLVSELVTNSLRYAYGPIGVRLLRVPPEHDGQPWPEAHPEHGGHPSPALLVEVSDPLPDPPRERLAGPEDEGGRGLQLVACSARRWGTRKGRSGKTVWFELALPG